MSQAGGSKADELIAVAAAVLSLGVGLFVPALLNDADTYWHVTAGAWMLAHHTLPSHDPFSYTFAGRPWQAHEWLSEVVLALAYRAAEWRGVVILCGLTLGLTAWLLARHLSRYLHGFDLGVTLLLALACLSGSLLARPHLLAFPLLEVWTASLIRAFETRRTPSFALLPAMALWANLHASFLLGLALIVPIAAASVANAPNRSSLFRGWALFAAGSLIATLVTPYGVNGWILPVRLMSMPSLGAVGEWHSVDLSHLEPFEIAIGVTVYVLVTRRVRVELFRGVILLGLVYLALAHVRYQVLLGLVGPLILGQPLGLADDRSTGLTRRPLNGAAMLACATAFMFLISVRLLVPLERVDGVATPSAAFAHVPAAIAQQPVLNDYAFGGFLIFKDIKPFIDSRAELYGEPFLERYARLIRPDGVELARTLSEYHVGWTIFAPGNPAAAAMDRTPGWRRIYADRWAVIHVPDRDQRDLLTPVSIKPANSGRR